MGETEQLVKVFVRLEADADKQTEHWWAEAESLWALPLGAEAYELRNDINPNGDLDRARALISELERRTVLVKSAVA